MMALHESCSSFFAERDKYCLGSDYRGPDYVCILIVLEDTQLFKIISLQVILQIIILKYTGFPKLLREYFLLQ